MSVAEPVSADRTIEIFDATKLMLDVWHSWEERGADSNMGELEEAISAAIEVVCYGGDIPQSCLNLLNAYIEFAELWSGVLDGSALGDDGFPIQGLWDRLGVVEKAYKATRKAAAAPKSIEPVAELLESFGKDHRRYEWVARAYGTKDETTGEWVGPFWDAFGVLQPELIEKEAKTPGSVIKDASQFTRTAGRDRVAENARLRLATIKTRLTTDESPEDPATIQELLEMGQYPDVIARNKGVTVEAVLEEAKRLDIEVSDREADLAYSPPTPMQDIYTGKTETPTAVAVSGAKLTTKLKTILADNPEADGPAAASALSKLGFSANMADITKGLEELKEKK